LGSFLRDPKTTGGSYSFTGGNKEFLRCEIGKYILEYDFINTKECKVNVKNGASIEETLKIPYSGNTPNYNKLFRMSCGLAKKLTNSK